MTRVFFSYKRDDPDYAAQIERIRAGLEAEGFDIFIDTLLRSLAAAPH